jgi:hypothetical protein
MMQTHRKYYAFFASAVLMWVVLFIIYPHYQYYIDPDGTAYLTISKRYANGHIQRAINGYWSPWACWLTAGLIKLGLAAIPASVVINALGATGFLFISQSFFVRFDIVKKMQWLLNITLAFFLCYAIFWQSFDDLWECFFLLSALRIMLVNEFKNRPGLWIAMGVIGTLAYFAKAYSFPFFILNTVCCAWFLTQGDKTLWLKISFTAIGVMILCSLPWIMALHNKYGIWTTSTSGTLNMSWYLVGHPHWKPGIDLLIPPAYPDSPYYWEDPWFANGDTPHFWDSWHLFGREIIRAGYHLVLFITATLQLSVFFPLITIVVLLLLLWMKKIRLIFTDDLKIAALSFVLFPLGYVLVNFESRYLWYMLPLSMLFGAALLQNGYFKFKIPVKLLAVIFPISFLITPIYGFVRMHYYNGREEFVLSQQLKAANIHGSFTGNLHPRFMSRLAYFSGNQYYFLLSNPRFQGEGLIDEMNRYKIDYYIHYKEINSFTLFDKQELFNDDQFLKENSDKLIEVKIDGLVGVEVFKINQK